MYNYLIKYIASFNKCPTNNNITKYYILVGTIILYMIADIGTHVDLSYLFPTIPYIIYSIYSHWSTIKWY